MARKAKKTQYLGNKPTRGLAAQGPTIFIVEAREKGNNVWLDMGTFPTEDKVLDFISTKMNKGDIESPANVRVLCGSLLSIGPALVAYGNGATRVGKTTSPRGRARSSVAHAGAQAQA